MVLLNRSELLERLKDNVVLVSFNKVNGTKREMRCTLQASFIPNFDVDHYIDSEVKLAPEDSGRLNVWDVDAEGWRSFLIPNVNYVLTPAPDKGA